MDFDAPIATTYHRSFMSLQNAVRYGFLLLGIAGCRADPPTMPVWGSVSYNGSPVADGLIVLFPIEGTKGPSTGAIIQDGQYRIEKHSGPYARGMYRVEITALGPERSYSPNASGAEAKTMRDQILSEAFNKNSELRVTISVEAGKNQHDFHLHTP